MELSTRGCSLLLFGLALGGSALGLTGCDPYEPVDVTAFEDGVAKDTEGGAFRVVLYARDGLNVGDNALTVHVGFHDPADPTAPGLGIPGARVHLDAWPIDGDSAAVALEAEYVGEGRYLFDALQLSTVGAWQFDFVIEVGQTLDESVAFAFEVP
jgi:hypothetical protein